MITCDIRLLPMKRFMLLFLLCQLLLVPVVMASVTWTAGFPQVVINQRPFNFWDFTPDYSVSVAPTAVLVSSTGANGSGSNQNYKINADQLGQSSFLLVDMDNPVNTIPFTLTYRDGASQGLTEAANSSSNFSGRRAGSNPQITVAFTAPGTWGVSAVDNTYMAVIDLCAFQTTINCGGGGGTNVQYDSTRLTIIFRGRSTNEGYVLVSGLDNLPMSDQGASWSATDAFCVGVLGNTNVRIRADSQTGSGTFLMQGPTPSDLLNYQLEIDGTLMTENTFQSFVGQSLNDCVNNINDFTIEAIADGVDVGNAAMGNYSDVITLTVEPI